MFSKKGFKYLSSCLNTDYLARRFIVVQNQFCTLQQTNVSNYIK